MKLNRTQVLVILGSAVLVVLLLFANTKLPEKEGAVVSSEHAGDAAPGDISVLLDAAKQGFNTEQKQLLSEAESAIKTGGASETWFNKLVSRWDSLKQPMMAAYYKEQQSVVFPEGKNWEEAGKRYYALAGYLGDQEKVLLLGKAAFCFEKALEKLPDNTDVKIDLASCYVEGGADPMKGIAMLREVEKTDSNNVKLQLNFAFFSVRSGQWDKAIARYQKVLKIKPDYYDVYLHLADVYTQKEDKENTIKSLEKYVEVTDDITLKEEVKRYINKLKTN